MEFYSYKNEIKSLIITEKKLEKKFDNYYLSLSDFMLYVLNDNGGEFTFFRVNVDFGKNVKNIPYGFNKSMSRAELLKIVIKSI